MARTRRQAAAVALVVAFAFALAPSSAPAQLGPPLDLSEMLSKPVDELEQVVGDQLAAIAPGVIDSGQPEQANPAQGANQADSVEPPAGDSNNDPAIDDGPEAEPGVETAEPGASEPARTAPAGDPDRAVRAPGAALSADIPGSEPAAEQNASQPSPDRGSNGRDSGVLERLVSFVPTPLKVAVGLLAALLAIAAFVAGRTRRRLRRAERWALTDTLTELPNRRAAEELLERLVAAARRNGRTLSAVLCDLDHFKSINDNHGHAIGDEALRAAAKATRDALRVSDHVARFGGEEFLVMLPETDRNDALIVAEKLRAAVAGVSVDGLDKGMTASFGVSVFPGDSADADELVATADQALYLAKEGGRDRVEVVDRTEGAIGAAA